jgi:hypothetical protein
LNSKEFIVIWIAVIRTVKWWPVTFRYHYELFGNNGNDIFFLGPQISFVQGGEDTDMYIVQAKKGKTYINNFSHKIDNDVLFLNISFSELLCYRLKDDLWISVLHDYIPVMLNLHLFSHFYLNNQGQWQHNWRLHV